jgi:tripartite-type tricarboxylate transporter receptor subunit TctC
MLDRRKFLGVLGGVAALPLGLKQAIAEEYPSRPLRILVGFAAGGNFDLVARIIAEEMAARLKQPVIVENRPGASSNIAAEAALRAPADGYTLFMAGAVNAINATLYDKLPFDFANDIAPISAAVQFPNVMTVSESFPARSVPEFISYA